MPSMKEMLLTAPEGQLDSITHDKIYAWDDEPNSLQVLEVLDMCIYSSLASGFVIQVLQIMLDSALKAEGQTLDDILPFAYWRVEH